MTLKPITFFITGYPRSGTTLLASLMDRHSNVAVTPETHFFRTFLPAHKRVVFKKSKAQIEAYCCYKRIKDLGLVYKDLADYTAKLDRWEHLFSATLNAYRHKANVEYIGEKTPKHILYANEIFQLFGEARIINIIRDGRDVVLSNINESWTHQSPFKQAAEWNFFYRKTRKIKQQYPDKIIEIKFEDLVTRPENEIKKVCQFIGIQFEPGQIEPHNNSESIPEWERNWKKKANQAPDSGNIEKWKSFSEKDMIKEISFIMYKHLQSEGYAVLNRSITLKRRLRLSLYRYPLYDLLKWIAGLRRFRLIAMIELYIKGKLKTL